LGRIALGAQVRGDHFWAQASIASPQMVTLALQGAFESGAASDQGLALTRLALTYPGGRWTSEGTAHVRVAGETVSLAKLRLVSQGQRLALDGEKAGDQIDAHLALEDFRLALLPRFLVDPALGLGGLLDADVRVRGALENPSLGARVELRQGRYQGFSNVHAKVNARLENHRVEGTIGIEAPSLTMAATVKAPARWPAPREPVELRADVTRLDIGETLRSARIEAHAEGALAFHLLVTGTALDPHLDATLVGRDLRADRPASARPAQETVDVGRGRVHLTYRARQARAVIGLASSRGGTLRVSAGARLDLSHPHTVTSDELRNAPVRGRLVARGFDVGWISGLHERLETLAGKLTADAAIAGTIENPRFIGDLRWKDGKLVANAAAASPQP
jgi:autotransporter translocation and assembly factor TamB